MTDSESEVVIEELGSGNGLMFLVAKNKATRGIPKFSVSHKFHRWKRRREGLADRTGAVFTIIWEGNNVESVSEEASEHENEIEEKADEKATGNKRLKLLSWGKDLFDAMNGNSNPVIEKIADETEKQTNWNSNWEGYSLCVLHHQQCSQFTEKAIVNDVTDELLTSGKTEDAEWR